jgi:hypothetical protein
MDPQRVGDKPFGIDLVLPASAPPADSLEALLAKIPEQHRAYAQMIKDKYDVPAPKAPPDLHRWGGSTRRSRRAQLDVILEEKAPVFVSGLGSPAFIIEAAHARGMKVFGLVGRARQAAREIAAGVDVIIAQGLRRRPDTRATSARSPSYPRSAPSRRHAGDRRQAASPPAGISPRRFASVRRVLDRHAVASHVASRTPT